MLTTHPPVVRWWFQDYDQLLHFGRVLDEAGAFESKRDVFYYLEKPWKWQLEFEAWCKLGRPASPSIDELRPEGVAS